MDLVSYTCFIFHSMPFIAYSTHRCIPCSPVIFLAQRKKCQVLGVSCIRVSASSWTRLPSHLKSRANQISNAGSLKRTKSLCNEILKDFSEITMARSWLDSLENRTSREYYGVREKRRMFQRNGAFRSKAFLSISGMMAVIIIFLTFNVCPPKLWGSSLRG